MELKLGACKEAGMRLRICVLTTTYPRDENDPCPPFVNELCQRLSGDFSVTVIAPAASGARCGQWQGVEVIRYRYAPMRFQTLTSGGGILPNLRRAPWQLVLLPALILGQAWALWRCRGQFDLIHAHWLIPQGLIALTVAGQVPLVCTSHGADVFALRGKVWDVLRRLVLRRSAAVSAVGPSLCDALHTLVPERRVTLLPMGIDLARFKPDANHPFVPGRLLFVGRLVPKKGLDLLLAALPSLVLKGQVREMHIVGDGPERASLEATAVQIALPIYFHGAVLSRELPRHYGAAELVVLPFCTAADGDAEGLGLTLIEALASGCKVVSGITPAQSTLPADCLGWWRCDARDLQALTAAISMALAEYLPSSRLRVDRENLLQPFGWQYLGDAYASFLRAASKPHTKGSQHD
ncbi:MAG: glycosyltransferase [Stagnimonas sp.]|nr:glycosyltransferase [Stagnimonas sp.]